MRTLKQARARRDFVATQCGHKVCKGADCWVMRYRERAVSYREAAHAGTMYPMRTRTWCAACGGRARLDPEPAAG